MKFKVLGENWRASLRRSFGIPAGTALSQAQYVLEIRGRGT